MSWVARRGTGKGNDNNRVAYYFDLRYVFRKQWYVPRLSDVTMTLDAAAIICHAILSGAQMELLTNGMRR